jgi:hypothetical protein
MYVRGGEGGVREHPLQRLCALGIKEVPAENLKFLLRQFMMQHCNKGTRLQLGRLRCPHRAMGCEESSYPGGGLQRGASRVRSSVSARKSPRSREALLVGRRAARSDSSPRIVS